MADDRHDSAACCKQSNCCWSLRDGRTCYTGKHTDTHTDRQTQRHTNTDRRDGRTCYTGKQTQRHTNTHTDRHTAIQVINGVKDTQTNTHTYI